MALMAAVLVLVPLLVAPGFLFHYDVTPKVAVLLLGTAAALIWHAIRGRVPGSPPSSSAGRWFSILLLAQAVSLAWSAAWSVDPALSFVGTNWRRFGVISQGGVLVFAWLLERTAASGRARGRTILRAVVAGGIPVAGYGVLQYFGWDPWLPAQAYRAGESVWAIVRPPATLGHAGYFGTYCLYVAFFSVGLAIADDSRVWRILARTAAGVAIAAVYLSGTRAALLGLAAGCILLAFRLGPRFRARLAAIAVIAGLAAGAFYLSPAGEQLRSRVHWSLEDPGGGARLLLWRDSLIMGSQRWAAGYGPETFGRRFPRFQSVELARAYPDFYQESPHNILLDSFASQGVLGVLLLVLTGVVAFRAAAGAAAANPQVSGALAAALAAGSVSQQFSSFTVPTALLFYSTAALLVSQTSASEEVKFRGRLASACALAGAVLLCFAGVRLLLADRALFRVQRGLDAGRIAEAVEEYRRLPARRLTSIAADLWYSRKLAFVAPAAAEPGVRIVAWQSAFEAAQRAAVTAEDRQNAFYNLAMFGAARNDPAGTEANLRAAIREAPHWFKPHWALARALQLAGRRDEAAAEAALAIRFDGGRNSEVRRTYSELQSK